MQGELATYLYDQEIATYLFLLGSIRILPSAVFGLFGRLFIPRVHKGTSTSSPCCKLKLKCKIEFKLNASEQNEVVGIGEKSVPPPPRRAAPGPPQRAAPGPPRRTAAPGPHRRAAPLSPPRSTGAAAGPPQSTAAAAPRRSTAAAPPRSTAAPPRSAAPRGMLRRVPKYNSS